MASLVITDEPGGRRVVTLAGRLDAATLPTLWPEARAALAGAPAGPIVVDAAAVDYCDGAGVALFVDLLRSSARSPASRSPT